MISPREETLAAAPVEAKTVNQSITEYIKLRCEEGIPATGDTYRHLRKHLAERFCAAFGTWPLSDVSTEHIRSWARTITNPRTGQPMDPLTVRHHLVDLKTFFKRAQVEGWIQRDPTAAVKLPRIAERDVNIIPVRDAFLFFQKNRNHRAIGRIAMEAFGGVRYTTAGKIKAADIKFDRQGIEMPSAKHKSTKRKYRQGQPACMWEWVKHAPPSCWDLELRQYAEEKKEMLIMAGLRPLVLKSEADREAVKSLKNVWRHSFATYLLAKLKNFGPVAYLMQHTDTDTTAGYEGRGDELDAYLYLSITPASVLLTWEEFHAKGRAEFETVTPRTP